MIPTIGMLIASYIITRMFQIVLDKRKESNGITLALAIITIIGAIYTIIYLISSGTQPTQGLFDLK